MAHGETTDRVGVASRRRPSLLRVQFQATLGAMRRPSLRRLLLAYFGYTLARKASRVVLLVHAFDLGGVTASAFVAVAMLLPAALAAPFTAALGDRWSPRRALVAGYSAQGLALAGTGAVVLLGGTLGAVAAGAALANVAFAATRPVHQAALPDVAEHPDELALGNAATVWVDGLASLLGPLAAGLLLAAVGPGVELLALAAVCLLAAVIVRRLALRRIVHAPSRAKVRVVLLEGLRELARDHDGARLTVLLALQYLVVGLLDVLLVVLVAEVLGLPAATVGLLAAAIGAGSLLGGTASVLLAGRRRLAPALVAGAVVGGVLVAGLGLGPGPWLAAAALAGYGAGKSVVTVAGQTLLQRTVPQEVAARIFGVQEGLIQLATAVGSALGPVLVLAIGPRGALVATGALLPVAVLAIPATLARLDHRAVVPGPVFDLLRGVGFLALLGSRTLERLARAAERVAVPAGSAVVRQGAPGDQYYVIDTGTAVVEVGGLEVRRLGPGEGFGEIALLEASPRTATVKAVEPTTLITLQRDDFLSALALTAPAMAGAKWRAADLLADDSRRAGGTQPLRSEPGSCANAD